MAALNFPSNPAGQTPTNTFSPTSTPDASTNGVTYIYNSTNGSWSAEAGSGSGSDGDKVTKIVAGSNVTISPTTGIGDVTINSTSSGGGGGGDYLPLTGGNLTGPLTSTSNITAAGNVTANKFIGDGSSLTNLPSSGGGSSDPAVDQNYTYPGAVTETVQNRLEQYVSVKDFGATGNGSTDDTTAIQNAFNSVFVTGGTIYFPAGVYNVTSTLTINRNGISGVPGQTSQRVNIDGAGKGSAVIKCMSANITALKITGDSSGSGAAHMYCTVSNIAIYGGENSRTSTGLSLQYCAYMSVVECTFHNLGIGLRLDGSLSNYFSGLVCNESGYGVFSNYAGFSAAHANLFAGCEFRFCTNNGYYGETGTSQVVFEGCQFEACGTMGLSESGGALFYLNSAAGEVGPSFYSCYFEVNKGGFDIRADASAAASANRVALANVYSCSFNRVGNDAIVDHPIVTLGTLHLNVHDSTFTGFGGYSASSNQGYISLSSSGEFTETGNYYAAANQKPLSGRSLSFAGYVSNSGSSGTLPNGFTVQNVATGVAKIFHNLGNQNYAFVATTNSGDTQTIQRCVMSNNNVQVVTVNANNALVNCDFGFILQPF